MLDTSCILHHASCIIGPNIGPNIKNEDDLENEDDLKNKDDLKNEADLKIETRY